VNRSRKGGKKMELGGGAGMWGWDLEDGGGQRDLLNRGTRTAVNGPIKEDVMKVS